MYILSLPLMEVALSAVSMAAIPTDPASVFVYILLVVSGYFIWRGSRSSSRKTSDATGDE